MARPLAQGISLGDLIDRFGGALQGGEPSRRVRRLAPLATAVEGDLSFLAAARMRPSAARSGASAVIVSSALADALPAHTARIVVDDPYAHFATVARWFAAQLEAPPAGVRIDPTAVVSGAATIAGDARVGPGCVVEEGAVVEPGAMIGAQCYLGRRVRIGAGTRLHPRVTVLEDCVIGARAIVHSGTVIGSDGFGFAREDERWAKIPQLGAVVIGDDVEIGANCAIDRGALDDTVIGNGCKLDNLIQIAHNVRIGEHTALAGCVGVAGSAVIGSRCMIGGSAGILGHLEICDDVVISAMSLVASSIDKPGFYSGVFPLMTNPGWERAAATLRQLPALRNRIRALERAAGANRAQEQGADGQSVIEPEE
jgi:UDP-3-O-[3-hydroxymyristoyl] glucosamine N-acyltransferase